MLKRFIVRRESSGKTNGSFRIPVGFFLYGNPETYDRLLSLADNFVAFHTENATNSPKVLMPANYMMKFDSLGDHHEILVQRNKLPPHVVELAEKEICETPSNLDQTNIAMVTVTLGDSYKQEDVVLSPGAVMATTEPNNDLLANALVTILNDKVERLAAELDRRSVEANFAAREIERLRARELKSGKLRLIYEDLCYCMVTMVDFHNLTQGTIGGIKAGLSRAAWRLDHDTMEGWAEEQAQIREYPEVLANLAELKKAWEYDNTHAAEAEKTGLIYPLGTAVRGVVNRLFAPKKHKTLA